MDVEAYKDMTITTQSPLYLNSSFSIVFPPYLFIRRLANDFEDALKGEYGQPQVLPVPDDWDPAAPRIIFASKRGFSDLQISQQSLTLSVNYSQDWQNNISLGRQYLLERVPPLFELLTQVKKQNKGFKPSYSGMATLAQIPVNGGLANSLSLVNSYLGIKATHVNTHDLMVRIATRDKQLYFSNLTIENYRSFKFQGPIQFPPRLKDSLATLEGVQITGDYNDRFAFQERETYNTTLAKAKAIINQGIEKVEQAISELRGKNE